MALFLGNEQLFLLMLKAYYHESSLHLHQPSWHTHHELKSLLCAMKGYHCDLTHCVLYQVELYQRYASSQQKLANHDLTYHLFYLHHLLKPYVVQLDQLLLYLALCALHLISGRRPLIVDLYLYQNYYVVP